MSPTEKIVNNIVDNVPWALGVDIIFCMIVLGILVKYFGLSPIHVFENIMEEIRKLFTGQVSRTSIDGGITFSLLLFTAIVLLFTVMHELPEMLAIFKVGVDNENQSFFLFIFMVCTTIITAIISLLITGPKRAL
jgi:hypothetical protein